MNPVAQILGLLQGGWRLFEVVIIFSILVLGHEFGHFVMAKISGMRVDEFAIGFWKPLFSWKRGETTYSVNLLPFGGYCRIYGMDLEEASTEDAKSKVTEDAAKATASTDELVEVKILPPDPGRERYEKAQKAMAPDYSIAKFDDPRAFANRPLHQRFAVAVSGPLANLAIAILVVFLMGITMGFPAAELGGVIPEGPAAVAGLKAGDIITNLDNVRVSSTADLHRVIAYSDGKPLYFKGMRGTVPFNVIVNPQQISLVDSYFCRLGFIYLTDGTVIYPLPGSPATRADLQPGDIVLSVDGLKFPSQRLDIEGGNGVVRFEVYRGYTTRDILIDYFDNELISDTYSSYGFFLDKDLNVIAVVPSDIAAEAGLQQGDHIVQSSIKVWSTTRAEATASEPKPLEVTYQRNGETRHASMKPDQPMSRIQVFMDDASLPILSDLLYSHPLYLAGLRSGDRITSIAGSPTQNGISALLEFEKRMGETVSVVALSRDKEVVVNITVPKETDRARLDSFLSGLHFSIRYFRSDPVASMVAGVEKCRDIMTLIFKTLEYLFTGRASVNDLSGPVGIATATYQAASNGFVDLINIMVLLSINLGIFNLLPFPALDGGRILFMIAEGIFRRPVVNVRAENIIHLAGFLLLIILALFVTYHDIARLIFQR
jgi:membrane-associated protease RseP (regulator of RpoE activity)